MRVRSFLARRALASAALLAALSCTAVLAVTAPAPAAPFHAGELHRVAHESTAAVRNHGDDTLRMTIWYPAVVGATEKTIVVGSADAPVFVAGRAAADAPWADTSMHPLVVLSHGFGGSARQMTWLGAPLARAGYVVVAVDHPGTNGVDGVTPQGAYAMWARAGDVRAALDFVLADPTLGPHIDAKRIGIAGFSLGGWTAALVAGARTDFARFDRFCASAQRDSICDPQLEFPLDMRQRHGILESAPMHTLAARENGNFRDTRIRAAFMIAPALVQALDPASLAAIDIPVAVLAGTADPVAIATTNAEVIAHDTPGARLTLLPNVGHYDFLSMCGAQGVKVARVYCTDREGVSRADTHAATIAAVTRFFDQELRRSPVAQARDSDSIARVSPQHTATPAARSSPPAIRQGS